MKNIKKLIMPALLIAVIALIYFTYFQKKGLGNFDDFDTNNNANKEIIVQVVKEKGANEDRDNQSVSFFAVDKKGVEVLVQAPLPLPALFENLDKIKLKGHRHPDHFHATEIKNL